ncbi:MAG: hypothetical protein IPP72_12920 [Chitinophagaceae bacterium]|nr:hypothetical protein [Chitinophagaceae bacterium]
MNATMVPHGRDMLLPHILWANCFGGGIVVSVWKENGVEKGLVATLTDVSAGAAWSNVTATLIGATAQSFTDGQANTNAIIAQPGILPAAPNCAMTMYQAASATGIYRQPGN